LPERRKSSCGKLQEKKRFGEKEKQNGNGTQLPLYPRGKNRGNKGRGRGKGGEENLRGPSQKKRKKKEKMTRKKTTNKKGRRGKNWEPKKRESFFGRLDPAQRVGGGVEKRGGGIKKKDGNGTFTMQKGVALGGWGTTGTRREKSPGERGTEGGQGKT